VKSRAERKEERERKRVERVYGEVMRDQQNLYEALLSIIDPRAGVLSTYEHTAACMRAADWARRVREEEAGLDADEQVMRAGVRARFFAAGVVGKNPDHAATALRALG
jgi:hypothetical protein